MEKHILKENIKVKGFRKKEWTQSETNKKQNRRERERERERERDFTHIICGLHQA